MCELRSKLLGLSAIGFRLSARHARVFLPRANSRKPKAPSPRPSPGGRGSRAAFTLVEMLVAMAITLVMMAAVVTLFANVSNSVRNRRATTEMTNNLRHVRNVLQQDLQGATCPGVTWQKIDSNHGYIELIEGLYSDLNPTPLVQDLNGDGDYVDLDESQLNPALSPIPRNNLGADANNDGKITTQELEAHYQNARSLVPGALGDFDDVIMLTTRNEREPFVGRMPIDLVEGNDARPFNLKGEGWGDTTIESTLAEVILFAIENPPDDDITNKFFGEPGMRTIYRRALLIAPWVNPYRVTRPNGAIDDQFRSDGEDIEAKPGLVRVLPRGIEVEQAIAGIIAFQERYDLSVRLEWDHTMGNTGRWTIVANTLSDLTKRENRYGHYGFHYSNQESSRVFPYAMTSYGRGYDNGDVEFVNDRELGPPADPAQAEARKGTPAQNEPIIEYTIEEPDSNYELRPFLYVKSESQQPATANAMLDDTGRVVRIVYGPVPLSGPRRGDDVMMTNVLGFDMRVFDPGAPLYGRRDPQPTTPPPNTQIPMAVLQPSDPGWKKAYRQQLGQLPTNSGFEFVGQGAYVDMGYGFELPPNPAPPSEPAFTNAGTAWVLPWFAELGGPRDISGIYQGYTVYDTWSFHYENNGVNEDNDEVEPNTGWQIDDGDNVGVPQVDEGTNGLDDFSLYGGATAEIGLGPDDVGERETTPPYDKPLRGAQVLIRTYELDSRAIRQVRVNQHFLPE
jgi:prepilin-type N-terminal cleavage/methylation domain-containing protein